MKRVRGHRSYTMHVCLKMAAGWGKSRDRELTYPGYVAHAVRGHTDCGSRIRLVLLWRKRSGKQWIKMETIK